MEKLDRFFRSIKYGLWFAAAGAGLALLFLYVAALSR